MSDRVTIPISTFTKKDGGNLLPVISYSLIIYPDWNFYKTLLLAAYRTIKAISDAFMSVIMAIA